jgi:cob(I)alamin adenosyltransferase
MKIYTKVGDGGMTGLFGGPRVPKDDLRVAAYGDVDELNSVLGLVRADVTGEIDTLVSRVQSELFTLGAQLATPHVEEAPKGVPTINEADIERMEHEIDRFDTELEPLKAFILPAGTRGASTLHLARTVCRRAERAVVTLSHHEPVPPLSIKYLNRLSDWLFTLARLANHRAGVPEAKWEPNKR